MFLGDCQVSGRARMEREPLEMWWRRGDMVSFILHREEKVVVRKLV